MDIQHCLMGCRGLERNPDIMIKREKRVLEMIKNILESK